MAAQSSFIQKLFYEISLEVNSENKFWSLCKNVWFFRKGPTCGRTMKTVKRKTLRGLSSLHLLTNPATKPSWIQPSQLQGEYMYYRNPTWKRTCTRKNNLLAKALKEKGNKSYGAGDNIEAMNLYNQALCYSRYDNTATLLTPPIVPSCEAGGEYSVILANRSALWAELGEHELVVADVDHAIEWVLNYFLCKTIEGQI